MLPFLTFAFIGGLAFGSLVPYYPLAISLLLCMLAAALTLAEARRCLTAAAATACLASVVCGVVYWCMAVERQVKQPFHEPHPDVFQRCTGRVVAPVQYSPGRMTTVVRCDPEPDRGPLIVRLTWREADRRLFHGDRIGTRARLRAPTASRNPGGFDYAAYLERQGIDAVATVHGLEAVEVLESGRDSRRWMIWNQFDRWRDAIRLSALHSLHQPALGLFLGVVIGERGYLDPDVRDQFMITGTVHLLSISGSHLGLVAMLAFAATKHGLLWLPASWLLHLSRWVTPTRVAAAVTVIPASAYACLAGAEVATVRSLVMVLVTLLAKWLGCEQRMFHALAAAALMIVLHDPQAMYDISFQLSFLSVCAVAWQLTRSNGLAADKDPDTTPSRFSAAKRWGAGALSMSALVTVTTVPLVAFYFNQVSWLGLVTNLLAVPLMGGVLVPLGLIAALGHAHGEALPFAAVMQWSMDTFISVLQSISQLPGGEWHVAAPSLLTVLVFYGCLAAVSVGSDRPRAVWVTSAALVLLVCWWTWSPRFLLNGDRFRITFLDVSQGDSAVLELPGGEVILIDGGASYERFDMGRGVVAPYLWNRGIQAIDYIIATHPQLDHVGGLAYVLRHFPVRHFWSTGDVRREPFYQRLQEALVEGGVTEHIARRGQDAITLGPCRVEVLNPPETMGGQWRGGRRQEGHTLNNRSIVTQITCGVHTLLFTGDVEAEALLRMSRETYGGSVEIVKVPHHGAASSFQADWLERINPRYAVISVGRHNGYGHPASAVVQAYADRGIALFRTDRDGGIWVTAQSSTPGVHIHRMNEQQAQRVPFPRCLWACERSNWERLFSRWAESD